MHCVDKVHLYDKLITSPEDPYRKRCVVVCNLEKSRMRKAWPSLGLCATGGSSELAVTNLAVESVNYH